MCARMFFVLVRGTTHTMKVLNPPARGRAAVFYNLRTSTVEPRSEDETGLIQDSALISHYFEGFDQILEEILDLEGL